MDIQVEGVDLRITVYLENGVYSSTVEKTNG